MSSSGVNSQPLSLPNRAQATFLDGIQAAVSVTWWRWFQGANATLNNIPDTAVIAELRAEVQAAQAAAQQAISDAAAAVATAQQAAAQVNPTLSYLALAILDGSAA